jgi:hypothetical protein
MSKTKEKDQAHPIFIPASGGTTELGLTKREEFAKAAMQGNAANPALIQLGSQAFAERCIEMADALIDGLNRKGT